MTGALSLLCGVLWGLGAGALPHAAACVAAGLLVVVGTLSSLRRQRWAGVACLFIAGQGLAAWQAARWLDLRVPVPGADSRALVEGRVVGVPARDGATVRFELRGEFVEGSAADGRERNFRLQWRDDHAAPRAGERWRFLIRLQPPEDARNFTGFDRARQSFRDDIHAAGRVLPSALNGLLTLAPAGLDTLRARIAVRIRDAIADPDAAALVGALAVGLTADMSRDQWRVFNATGSTHLVAISGMHVTLFAWLAFRAARLGWRVLPAKRHVDRETFALLLGLVAAGGYALLAGWSVPTQRTWLMLALYVGARLSTREVSPGRLWSLALILVLLLDVRAPLAAGFWLSFVAVGVLLAFMNSAGRGWLHATTGLVRTQFAIMMALAPAGFAVFGGLSLVGLGVNLLAIPIISFVFVPVVLAGAMAAWLVPGWCAPCFGFAATLYDLLWPALVWCADLDLALWRATPNLAWFALAIPAALVWLCRWPWPLRLTALCAPLALMFPAPEIAREGDLRVSVIDADRGAAVLLRTATHSLLYDTGDGWNTHGSRLATRVLPVLDAARVREVDALVLPVLNEDRAEAVALLASERGVRQIWLPGEWPGSGLAVARCRGQQWRWDGVDFELEASRHGCELRVRAGDMELQLRAEQSGSLQWIEIPPGLVIAMGGVEGAQSRAAALERRRAQGWRVLDTHRDGGIEIDTGDGLRLRAAAWSRHPFHWRRATAEPVRPPV